MSSSIYQKIVDQLAQGEITEMFYIDPNVSGEGEMKWAPGAYDGIMIYHYGIEGPDGDDGEDCEDLLWDALEAASKRKFKVADVLFAELTSKYRAVGLIDTLQTFVIENAEDLDIDNIFDAAVYMIRNSEETECVKVGLELLEIFEVVEEDIREVIRTVALYEEFTLFSIFNMIGWEDGNDELFKLAQKVHGWGRIHAVERLQPETEEIRHWLLTEGTVNNISNSYSALVCWTKSDAEKVLFGIPSEEEFKGIGTLLLSLIDESPVPGISEMEEPEKIIRRYLDIAQDYTIDKEVIKMIKFWAGRDQSSFPSIIKDCNELMTR